MRFFFIDLENVRSEGLEGVGSLCDTDMVFIYYSENAMNLSIPTLENLNNSRASKKFIKTNYIGKNAMDFQIVSLFGAMIEREKGGSFYIISQDNGFRSAVSFCESYFEDYGIRCGVYPTIISAITAEMKNKPVQPKIQGKHPKNESAGTAGADAKGRDKNPGTAKGTPENEVAKNGTQTVDSRKTGEEETQTSGKKKRRRRKKSGAGKDDAQNVRTENSDVVSSEDDRDFAEDTSKTVTADETDSKSVKNNTGAQNAQKPAANSPEGRLGYIYAILKELLSEKTISIYAEAIDEGIAKCKNRNELHDFYHQRFGDDEGEALYKITQGDFEKMKQARPSRPSRTHRRPKKNLSANNQTVS